MNLLFVHSNFPGQFTKIAPFLASQVKGRTVFLSQSHNPQNLKLRGVELVTFKPHRDVSPDVHRYLRESEHCVLRGQALIRALEELRQKGFVPDVVIAHGGRGFGLFLKNWLPSIRLITYLEWFPRAETSHDFFDKFDLDQTLMLQIFRWPLLEELRQSDDLVCPTFWQRSQFPEFWRNQIKVIFDGIDLSFFKPDNIKRDIKFTSGSSGHKVYLDSEQRVLSYATRGMEPLRGFPEFMRAAAVAQKKDSRLQVVIAGNDRVVYSYKSKHHTGSWKQQMLEELSGNLDLSRVHFTGLLNYGELVSLYRRSDLHCYFTRPFVLSWSVFEAAACGARLLVNAFPGLEEVLSRPPVIRPVDLENQQDLAASVLSGLAMERDYSVPPKSNLCDGMDLDTSLRKWSSLILN